MYAEDRGSPGELALHGPDVHALSKQDLHALVGEWTLILKKEGLPPEKVLVAVKTLVRELLAPHVTRYDDVELSENRAPLIAGASQCCIDVYFRQPGSRTAGRGKAPDGNGVARRSLSRGLLVKLLVMRRDLPCGTVASRLSVDLRQLASFACGTQLMPIDVQQRLAELVLRHEPRLAQPARRLELQIAAARRYQSGEVIRHSTHPRAQ